MAKVISLGRERIPTAQHQCHRCDSVIDFYKPDLHHDQRDGSYVVCPVCSCLISDNLLKWVAR